MAENHSFSARIPLQSAAADSFPPGEAIFPFPLRPVPKCLISQKPGFPGKWRLNFRPDCDTIHSYQYVRHTGMPIPSPGGRVSPQGTGEERRQNRPRKRSDRFSKLYRLLARIPLQSANADSFIFALRAAFGGCAPKRACGRSPRGKRFRHPKQPNRAKENPLCPSP